MPEKKSAKEFVKTLKKILKVIRELKLSIVPNY